MKEKFENIEQEINKSVKNIVSKKTGTKKRVNSIRKGHTFERVVGKQLTELLGFEIVRVPMSGGFGTMNSSNQLTGDLMAVNSNDKLMFEIECKHYSQNNSLLLDLLNTKKKNIKIFDWILQSTRDSYRVNKVPFIIFKVNRGTILGILRTKELKADSRWFLYDKNLLLMFKRLGMGYIISPLDNIRVKDFHEYLLKNGVEK